MSISSVTSEALQLKLRQLLPSQQGFGTDLSASDTIIPVIDLTQAAEGSDVGENLQTALAYGSQTSFSVRNTTTVIANNAGFWRVVGSAQGLQTSAGGSDVFVQMTDGITPITVWYSWLDIAATNTTITTPIDLVFFLDTGISLQAVVNNNARFSGSARQIADKNGTLIQPSGFSPQ